MMGDVDDILRKRREAKARTEDTGRVLLNAHDQLIIATAAANSNTDPAFIQSQENWRNASSDHNDALNEYTQLLGPDNT